MAETIGKADTARVIGGLRRMGRALKAGWLAFARIVHRVNTAVILTLVYFVVVAPINLVSRLVRADLLNRCIGDEPSFWVDAEAPSSNLEECRRQF
jgi:hypothetical protein